MFYLHACMCTTCVPVGSPRNEVADPLSHHVGIVIQTQVLCKSTSTLNF